MSLVIIDKMPQFKKSLYGVFDSAIREAARDGYINAKTHAPFDEGELRGNSDVKRVKALHQRIRFWMEYARFQEFGGDSKRRVRHYKTPGTGKHYLKNAGDEQARQLGSKLKKHAQRARP
jgi:hypothetical protein